MNKLKENIYCLGSKSSFEQVYRTFWKKLYVICYEKTRDTQLSEEMVQEIFINLWKRKADLPGIESIEGYLVICAKNRIMDHYRKVYGPKEVVAAPSKLCEEQGFDGSSIVHNEAVEAFLRKDLELVVDQLPSQCQKVYRLSREENMTNNEIAVLLGISQKTVKNHITKALAHIKSRLWHPYDPSS